MSEDTRIPVKTLTKMMVAGQNQIVMKYLRTLPSDECAEVREQLIKNLELIQQQQQKKTPPRTDSPKESKKEPAKPTSSSGSRSKTKPIITNSSLKDSRGNLQITTTKDAGEDFCNDRPQVGNYIYQKDLGKGQFGVVFKAKHSVTGIRVAIKEIDSDQVSASNLPGIMKEAEVMAELDHVNCLKIIEVIKTKKKIYFILDYINRGSLLGLLKTQGNFPDEVASYCARHTCEGLKYLHGKNIIHRDIKCANLLINDAGVIKLADFGTAKEDVGKNITVIGTPFWMAPEIIEVSGATMVSDIWSLGCTIVEMLRGTPPYFELVTMQALFKIVEDAHPPIPTSFSEEAKSFLLKNCFVKDIKKRSTADGILKTPWIEKSKSSTFDYSKICMKIKSPKESPSTIPRVTQKGKSSSSSKYPTAPTQATGSMSVGSSAKYPSLGSTALSSTEDLSLLEMNKIQLEIEVEQLTKEHDELKRIYALLTC